ncbi:hypothetical protein RSAG8_00683, partial [Rhizoctonia solani AG-8 WAC10335]
MRTPISRSLTSRRTRPSESTHNHKDPALSSPMLSKARRRFRIGSSRSYSTGVSKELS